MRKSPSTPAVSFILVAAVLLGSVGLVMGEFRFDDRISYRAVFSNINGLHVGDEVRAAGITVGSVTGIELRNDNVVEVNFQAASDVPIYVSSGAAVRYKSLTGTKYLEISRGNGPADALAEGGVLPLEQTDPGLDLDAVFNSFQPLVQGLSPDQINQLSGSIIEVFQGQSGAIESLLSNLGQLVSTLADREAVIDELITNFTSVLTTMDERRAELDDLVTNVRTLVHGLAKDRYRIVDSVSAISDLAYDGSAFLAAIRPGIRSTVQSTRAFTGAFNSDLELVEYYLNGIPTAVNAVARMGAYGSFYNLYFCGVSAKLTGPDGTIQSPDFRDQSPRCLVDGEE